MRKQNLLAINRVSIALGSMLVAAALLASTATTAQAAITVDNPSFESPDVGSSFKRDAADQWTAENNLESAGGSKDGLFVISEDTSNDIPSAGTDPDDQWQLFDQRGRGRIYQNVGTVQPDTVYELEIGQIGSRGNQPLPDDFFFGLWADSSASPAVPGNELAKKTKSELTFTNVADNTKGVDGPFSVQFDSAADSAHNGENLFVRIGIPGSQTQTNAQQVLFDDVSVTTTVIPEPTSLALLAPAGLLLARRREQRKG